VGFCDQVSKRQYGLGGDFAGATLCEKVALVDYGIWRDKAALFFPTAWAGAVVAFLFVRVCSWWIVRASNGTMDKCHTEHQRHLLLPVWISPATTLILDLDC
jgi:hypothetical protein